MATRFSWHCLILAVTLLLPVVAHAGLKDTFIANALPGEPRPTVIFLHGGGSTGPKMSSYIQINRALGLRGAVAIYPSGFKGHWNDGRGGSPRNDIRYLDSMIDFYVAQKIIDPNRLYIAGISNGGMLTLGMICASGYQFRGAAIVGATFPRKPYCSKAKPTATILIYGSEDKYFPPDGEPGNSWHGTSGVATRKATIDYLATLNGCKGDVLPVESQPYPSGLRVLMHAYQNCVHPLQVYDLVGTGHVWPGAKNSFLMEKVMGPNPGGFGANDILIQTWFPR